MPTIVVDINGFGPALRRKLQRDLTKIEAAAFAAVQRGVREAVVLTNKEGLVDQGAYKLAFKARRTAQGAELRNDAPHAGVIEFGRRPNRPGPPVAPIIAWVQRKLGLSGNEAKAAGWAIRNAIHRRGTPPKAIMRRTIPKLRRFFRQEIRSRLSR